MFVRAVVRASVTVDGRVVAPSLAGRWMCPMHPEVVEDGPGSCEVCGMPLVGAETLGYTGEAGAAGAPLVVPVSAVLITGRRAVVYVEDPKAERPTFEGREVVLGPRAGDFYLVRDGLREGERVVMRGAFRIDSALQIEAKPAMMTPGREPAADRGRVSDTGGAAEISRVAPALRAYLGTVLGAYATLRAALADDDVKRAREAAKALRERAGDAGALGAAEVAVAEAGVDPRVAAAWTRARDGLAQAVTALDPAGDLEALRRPFAPLSEVLAQALSKLGHAGASPVLVYRCPMAFGGRGGLWVQLEEPLANPYFGHAMLRCGTETRRIPGSGGQ
jgi:Cu(I)/Ag(I) efflux system membrane fusion protein